MKLFSKEVKNMNELDEVLKNNSEISKEYEVAEIVEEHIEFDKEEILDVKWIPIEDIKKMKKEELRGYEIGIKTIDDIENNNIYPLDIFDNNKYNS